MVVRMVVKNRCRACLYADLWSSFRLSLSVTMSRRVMPLSGIPACGVPPCAVPQGVRDVAQGRDRRLGMPGQRNLARVVAR